MSYLADIVHTSPNRVRAHRLLQLIPIICALLCVTTEAAAKFRIDVWNTESGLPQNSVYSVLQTRDGYLWLTTLDGLVRYDGAQFKIFNRNNTKGIRNNRFTQLVEDADGNLWATTEGNELIRYRDGLFTPCSAEEGCPDQPVQQILTDDRGAPLFVTLDALFTWSGGKFMAKTAGDYRDIYIHYDKEGALWLIGKGLLRRFKDGDSTVYRLDGASPSTGITGVCDGHDGALWVGTMGAGMFKMQNGRLTSYRVKDGLPSDFVSPKWEDRKGNLWLATSKGLSLLSDGKFRNISTAEGLSSDLIKSVYEDREGTIWVGTINAGLNRITEQTVSFYTTDDGLASNNVYPISEDSEGNVWVGGDGITIYKGGRFSGLKAAPVISALHAGRDGRMWVGGFATLLYFKDGRFVDFAKEAGLPISIHQVNAIYEDRDGTLWVGTSRILFSYRDGQVTLYSAKEGYDEEGVRAFLRDSQGRLWVATYGGLLRFDNGSFVAFKEESGLSSNYVRSLYEDGDGVLWVGTYDGGLNRFKDGKFTRYGMEDGLFSDGVFQILDDSRGNLWMSSNRGIYRTSRQQLNDFADGRIKRITSVSYGKQDGLLNTECNGGRSPAGIRASDGRLWFPTQGGVAVIDPGAIRTNPLPPPLVIQSCEIDGRDVDYQKEIELSPSAENLEITYAGLSFVKPEQVTFKYRLVGLDSEWVEAGTRRAAYYSHLPPGSYTFEVMAANADGVWSTSAASIRVRVIPPFWRTWWFSALAVLLVAAVVGGLFQYRVSRLRKAEAAREAFARRLVESQEQERKRIAAELHDSLGQNLLIVKNWALIGLKTLGANNPAREQLTEINETTSLALNEVREIAHNLRPYQLERLGLTSTLEYMLRNIQNSSDIDFTVELENVDGLLPAELEINLYRIVQECVNNVIKHSSAAHAWLSIKRTGQSAQIVCRDDGKGFDIAAARSRQNGMGLSGLEERVRMLGGRWQVESQPGAGTTVTITINGIKR
jgi:signal transduction histidine kinase/ligand-binding sensor domain-containing protein